MFLPLFFFFFMCCFLEEFFSLILQLLICYSGYFFFLDFFLSVEIPIILLWSISYFMAFPSFKNIKHTCLKSCSEYSVYCISSACEFFHLLDLSFIFHAVDFLRVRNFLLFHSSFPAVILAPSFFTLFCLIQFFLGFFECLQFYVETYLLFFNAAIFILNYLTHILYYFSGLSVEKIYFCLC